MSVQAHCHLFGSVSLRRAANDTARPIVWMGGATSSAVDTVVVAGGSTSDIECVLIGDAQIVRLQELNRKKMKLLLHVRLF